MSDNKGNILKGFKKIFKKENPYNGGNSFQMEKILETRWENTLAWVNRENNINREMYNEWELLNFQADYNASIVRFTFSDSLLDNMIYLLFRLNFLYGNVGILFKDGKPIPIVENKTTIDEFGEMTKIEGFNGYELLQSNGLLSEVKSRLQKKYTITKNDMDNYIRLYAPSYNYGAYVRWMKFIRMWGELLKTINTYSYLLIKKIIFNVNDEGAAIEEIKRFFSSNSPFLINKDPDSATENRFEVAGMDNGGSGELFTYYDRWMEIFYSMLGRRINVDRKKERNITNEVEMSESNFDILENEIRVNRTNFLNEFSKKVKKPVRIIQEDKDSDSESEGGDSNKPNGKDKKEPKQDM